MSIESNVIKYKREFLDGEFAHLNKQQRQAVFTVNGPLLILAGAGSGKTTVLINRIAYMLKYGDSYNSEVVTPAQVENIDVIENYDLNKSETAELIKNNPVKPWQILAITFTNKAAGELRQRISDKVGEAGDEILAATFHSACVRILRRYIDRLGYSSNFTIYDSDDQKRVIKQCMKEAEFDEKMFPVNMIASNISRAKDSLKTPEMYMASAENDYKIKVISQIYKIYQEKLFEANAVDFDDIINLTVRLLQEHDDILEYYQKRYRYIMVDEYQDTNHAQYMLVTLLSSASKNICVVGDDDQSIYKFRGANIENILGFEAQFSDTKVIKLEQNYRSTTNILNAANSVIENNRGRRGKNLWSDMGEGEKTQIYRCENEHREAEFVSDTIINATTDGAKYSDFAILYRMNAQSASIEQYFLKAGIPYRLIGGVKFFQRKEIKDVTAYLNFINNTSDSLRLKRIINEPKRGIGMATVNLIEQLSIEAGVSMYDVIKNSADYEQLKTRNSKLQSFKNMIEKLRELTDTVPLGTLYETMLDVTGYIDSLEKLGVEGRSRVENVDELYSNINQFTENSPEPTLAGFLEEISLYTELDTYDGQQDAVTMMTIHSAKGLEFKNVFIIGAEDGIFPGYQSLINREDLEEERRLAYVGFTRAKKMLYITAAAQRMLFGQTQNNNISRFATEIPDEYVTVEDKAARYKYTVSNRKNGFVSRMGGGITISDDTTSATPATKKVDITVGDKVSHQKFGEGSVISASPMGGDMLLEVEFSDGVTKKLMQNFAKLKKLD